MIEFSNVCKAFNGRLVFNHTSFHVRKNEIVGFLGRSGVGKSTILRMISGLVSPDSGKVKVNSSRIGYIFQEPRLIPWKTALENICFGLQAMGTGAGDAKHIALDYLEKLDLKGFENHYPNQLSGGMCQRVSIGRAFAVKPAILLMDEPFSALDLGLKDIMLGIIRDMLARQPLTLLYVSHDPEEVSRLATRLLLLLDGGIIQELTPDPNRTFKRMLQERFRNRTLENRRTYEIHNSGRAPFLGKDPGDNPSCQAFEG